MPIITGYMLTVLFNIRRHLIILRIEKGTMEFFHVVLSVCGTVTVPFCQYQASSGSRETVCITHMVIPLIFPQAESNPSPPVELLPTSSEYSSA